MDMDHFWAVLNTVMNLRVTENSGNLTTPYVNASIVSLKLVTKCVHEINRDKKKQPVGRGGYPGHGFPTKPV